MSELWQQSASKICQMVRSKQVSALEVTEANLNRLQSVNSKINAVVDEFPEQALAAAKEVDQQIAQGKSPGILAGVPLTVKVNVDQRGHATTNGLTLQSNLIAEQDSPVVSNFRNAGGIIIGRTNTPAFSLRWFTRNNLHGHTLNPQNRLLTPGGSSGGGAAAVAAGIGAIGHGTDIGGSVRYPAYACGIHGLRPTLGRIPAWNASSADRHIGAQLMAVSGPMARSIDDIELALTAMSVGDNRDPWWVPVPLQLDTPHKKVALEIAPDDISVEPRVETDLRDAADRLRAQGWQVDEVKTPGFAKAAKIQLILWMSEFRRGAAAMVDKENEADSKFVYGQLNGMCSDIGLNDFLDALQQRVGIIREWQQFLEQYPLVLSPVSGELPFTDLLDIESESTFQRVFDAQLTQVGLPVLGLPGLTVSTKMHDGNIPGGVQLIAGRYQEQHLCNAARVIEAAGSPPSPVEPS